MERWKVGFYVYMLLSSMVYGIYSVMSRDLVKTYLGFDYRFMTVLISAETIPMLFSVLAGGLGDVISRRNVLALGTLASVPLYLMGVLRLDVLPLLAAGYVSLWTLASPSVTGAFLDATSSSGMQYSLYAMFGSIGWGSGGLLAGLLKGAGGKSTTFAFAAIAMAISFVAAYLSYPKNLVSKQASPKQVFRGVKDVAPLFVIVAGVMASINLFYGNYSLRLREIAGSTELFGVIYTTLPAATGALVRPIAGRLSDRFSPKAMLAFTILAYIVLFPLMSSSWGLPAVLLWLIPLYPFMDQGSMMTVSRSLPASLQGVAAGVISTCGDSLQRCGQ
ncbi:MAG: MFS transporter [Desulfurococcales archaeon]|nr:MFS transporter [Desulfurococcales archaeon]